MSKPKQTTNAESSNPALTPTTNAESSTMPINTQKPALARLNWQ
jgi:hypothetical protein